MASSRRVDVWRIIVGGACGGVMAAMLAHRSALMSVWLSLVWLSAVGAGIVIGGLVGVRGAWWLAGLGFVLVEVSVCVDVIVALTGTWNTLWTFYGLFGGVSGVVAIRLGYVDLAWNDCLRWRGVKGEILQLPVMAGLATLVLKLALFLGLWPMEFIWLGSIVLLMGMAVQRAQQPNQRDGDKLRGARNSWLKLMWQVFLGAMIVWLVLQLPIRTNV